MKRQHLTKLTLLILTSTLLMLITACSSNPHLAKGYENPTLEQAPDWVFNPEWEGTVAEVGSAPSSPGGFQFQRSEALANARDELARKVQVAIKSILKQHAEQNDNGRKQTLSKLVANISDQITNLQLVGSMQKDLWIATDGTMFVLVAIERDKVADILKEAELLTPENEKSFWNNVDISTTPDRAPENKPDLAAS